MKKTILFLLFQLIVISAFSQVCTIPELYSGQAFNCDKDTDVINFPITYSSVACRENGFVIDQNQVPSWMTVTDNFNSITINCEANLTGEDRNSPVIYFRDPTNNDNNTNVLGFIIVNQSACEGWYSDSDGDGFGDLHAVPIFSCTVPFAGAVANNDDNCPDLYSLDNNGCEPSYVHEDINWITSKTFDINGNIKANSKVYYDDLGKNIQSQSLDIETNKTWADQTLYDAQGRPTLQTLNAPIATSLGTFDYKTNFIRNQSGSIYSETDLENTAAIGDQDDTLGEYYSTKNTDTKANYIGNNFHDITSYPFAKTIYSDLNPGAVLKTNGGKQLDLNLEIKSHSFSMPASQELAQTGAFDDSNYNTVKTFKTIVRDAHGIETVVFTDTDGKTLASARSGNEENPSSNFRTMELLIQEQGFVDLHIPVGLSGITINNNNANRPIEIFDLITEQVLTTQAGSLPAGFYRVSITDLSNYNNDILIQYKENYYDYSLNEYDQARRLIASYQPLNKLKSEFNYNALGQLIYSIRPDEGEAWFKYRTDGQIRYSQNSKQLTAGEFSYTNYDDLARPIESGVLVSTAIFANLDPDDLNLPAGTTKEQQFTIYDALNQADLNVLGTLASDYHNPTFLSGNVAKTNNGISTSYYAYDIYGRVKWMVQDIIGLGLKIIDYTYDPITGSVLEVDFQKHVATERYIHKYTYNIIDQLTKIETSTNGTSFTEQAKYFYYETGEIRRIELAEDLQGIDYIYNLGGQLKAINDPDGNDPGKDGKDGLPYNNGFNPDAFSMTLDYYTGDYDRATLSTASQGTDQYNGNIKAMTWKTNHPSMPGTQTYYYDYNKNNWLANAGLNAPVDGTGSPIDHIIKNTIISTNIDVLARESITLLPGFHVAHGVEFVAKIDPNATSNVDNGDYNVSNLRYDANGNLLELNRNKHTENGTNAMDQLTYIYKPNLNQLDHVSDEVNTITNANDIKTQSAGNYEYNEIGQLVKNNEEGIIYEYTVSGLVSNIKKTSVAFPNGEPYVSFIYNDRGHRVLKKDWINEIDTYYVRDAAGNTLAIYSGTNQIELPIYGASRLGVHYKANNKDVYQLTDHLGNIRAVVERANPVPTSTTDYYPFGMPIPGRQTIGANVYRYSFQGQEKDPETGKEAFELRLWDSRIGRWLSPDPYSQFYSPYLGMGNNPINGIDPDGGCWVKGVRCADGKMGDTQIGDNGSKWTFGKNGWETPDFDASSIDVGTAYNPKSIWDFRFNIKDPFPDVKWNWFEDRVSGNPTYGNGFVSTDLGNKRGRNSVIYNTIQGDDLPTLGGGGQRIRFWKHKENYGSIFLHVFKEGVSAEGEISNLESVLFPPNNTEIKVRVVEYRDNVNFDVNGYRTIWRDSIASDIILKGGDLSIRTDSVLKANLARKNKEFYWRNN